MNKDKYYIFIMGDFNIDLLQYDTHNSTNDFLNSMISHSFLPYVLQPTRVPVPQLLTIFFLMFISYCINTTKYLLRAIFKENELASSPLIFAQSQYFVVLMQ